MCVEAELRLSVLLYDCAMVQEEGIIVKDALSQWKCNDRGNSWLKVLLGHMLCCACTLSTFQGPRSRCHCHAAQVDQLRLPWVWGFGPRCYRV